MLLADTMAVVFSVLGICLTFPAFWLLLYGLFPGTVLAAAEIAPKKRWLAFLIGLPIVVTITVAAGLASKLPEPIGGLFVIALISISLTLANLGLSGLVLELGRRLRNSGWQPESAKDMLTGSFVLVLSFVLPVVGWFFLLPLAITMGFGIFIRTLFKKKAKA